MYIEYEVRVLEIDKASITTKDMDRIYLDYGYNLQDIKDRKLEEDRK
ncbi:MAG: hypothetical protein HFJ12_02815 [Bacilli bacterium]|nr:hypothetical protein [Bacilli bacterium]